LTKLFGMKSKNSTFYKQNSCSFQIPAKRVSWTRSQPPEWPTRWRRPARWALWWSVPATRRTCAETAASRRWWRRPPRRRLWSGSNRRRCCGNRCRCRVNIPVSSSGWVASTTAAPWRIYRRWRTGTDGTEGPAEGGGVASSGTTSSSPKVSGSGADAVTTWTLASGTHAFSSTPSKGRDAVIWAHWSSCTIIMQDDW